MYKPVSLLILYDNLILFGSEIEYLVLNNDNEEFFSMNVNH